MSGRPGAHHHVCARCASQAVVRMLEDIGTPENIPHALAMAKDKNNPFRLMGFGHRVYKAFDPRCCGCPDAPWPSPSWEHSVHGLQASALQH